MKRSTRILATFGLAAIFALGVSACDDDDNPVGNGNGNGNGGNGSTAVVLAGDITTNRVLSADSTYVIQGFLEVRPGGVLTVPAGTQLFSDPATSGTIVTLRGESGQASGRLVVQGTAANPVVFRPGTLSDARNASLAPAQVSSCARGAGGGIVLHGNAPINQTVAISEGVSRPFGGDDATDSSGDIQYLVILCGGTEIAPDNEINGLTFAGTGSGTRISHVQSHLIADDGFEWFGGTTNADHLISSGNDDDALDCDFGWTGGVQFYLVIQDRDLANRGTECDNDGDGSDRQPITNPNFWNGTYIGAGVEQANSEINDGPFLRRNSEPEIHNAIIANFGNAGIVIDGAGSQAQAAAGDLNLDHILFFNNRTLAVSLAPADLAPAQDACLLANVFFRGGGTSGYHQNGVAAAFGGDTYVCADPQFTSVNLADPIDGTKPDPRPQSGSPALDAANAATPTGTGVIDAGATYLGGFNTDDWTAGWSVWVDAL
ncbi:MAG: hypothetical protein R3326_06920 [Gemmatimonadota bacterium]|nr:hypothetical protein [Gemmatimonadota bacterium]